MYLFILIFAHLLVSLEVEFEPDARSAGLVVIEEAFGADKAQWRVESLGPQVNLFRVHNHEFHCLVNFHLTLTAFKILIINMFLSDLQRVVQNNLNFCLNHHHIYVKLIKNIYVYAYRKTESIV